jgi:transposase
VTPGHRGDVRVAAALIGSIPPGACLAGDTAYDSDALRCFLIGRGTVPVIPNNPTRKALHPFDDDAYRRRNLIERMFCRLKDWRRIANPLRQARRQLRRSRRTRSRHHLVDLIESGP